MATLSLKTRDDGTLTKLIDTLYEDAPDLLPDIEDNIRLVYSGINMPGASSSNTYVGIELNLPDMSEETAEKLRPMFRLLVELVQLQSGEKIEATVVFEDEDGKKIRQINPSSDVD